MLHTCFTCVLGPAISGDEMAATMSDSDGGKDKEEGITLRRELGLFSAVNLIVGVMIG
jgi:hypothetical protein